MTYVDAHESVRCGKYMSVACCHNATHEITHSQTSTQTIYRWYVLHDVSIWRARALEAEKLFAPINPLRYNFSTISLMAVTKLWDEAAFALKEKTGVAPLPLKELKRLLWHRWKPVPTRVVVTDSSYHQLMTDDEQIIEDAILIEYVLTHHAVCIICYLPNPQ